MIIKVGKKRFFRADLVDTISSALKMSKSEVKRLIRKKAVDLYIEEVEENVNIYKDVNDSL